VDLRAVKSALADACENVTVDGKKLHTYSYRPNGPIAPAFYVVNFGPIDPHMTMGGRYLAKFKGTALVSTANDRQSQGQLDYLMSSSGPASIYAALESTPGVTALGGIVEYVHVPEIGEPAIFTFGTSEFYGVEFTIEVLGLGS
jgi:hypothetical protein